MRSILGHQNLEVLENSEVLENFEVSVAVENLEMSQSQFG
jgi:hypothetical protein